MEGFNIKVTKSPDFKNIVIQDETTWTEGSLSSLSGFVLKLYTTDLTTPLKEYTFSEAEEASFIANSTIILSFLTMFGSIYLPDNWYDVKLVTDTHESNFDGFAVYARLKPAIYINNLNNLHTPDKYRGSIEPIALQVMMLNGLDYLDTSSVNDRRIKSLKRMIALLKMNK